MNTEITPELIEKLKPFQKGHVWKAGERIIFLEKHILYVTGRIQLWTGIGSKRWLETTDEIGDVAYYPTEGDLCRMLRECEDVKDSSWIKGSWRGFFVRVTGVQGREKEFYHDDYYIGLLNAVRWAVYEIEEE